MPSSISVLWKHFLPDCTSESVASKIKLTLLMKSLRSLERILALKILMPPVSENAWTRLHSRSLILILQNWSNSTPATRKNKLRLEGNFGKGTGADIFKFGNC